MLNEHIDLTGKIAIITGASRGIGEAAARRLAKANATVVLLARSSADIEHIASELGDNARAIACDVADWHAVAAAVDRVFTEFGKVDILVNNAGVIDPIHRIEDADVEGWSRTVDINLKGAFHCIRAVLPIMKANGAGTIINISSGAATSALEGWSHYCSTKAAVLMLTRCVAKEEAGNGIRCVGLSPGTVATEFQRRIKAAGINPVSKLGWEQHIPPEWAAEAIAWLTTEQSRIHDGGDFSIKTNEGREFVGLPAL
ncbi:SDR family oxidoreductase [Qipengyuania sp. S6317L1]|uniref:SDR family oxidoreductase n=1 Tax=Qipengyuania sp. S6317L1 TaxID=2926410 RepID=UPI001FF415A1|nr:SDR family oxidoreductase [Qipengyuania sp. S6317L1]MCK0099655.1 SDR family oxidoreductase [Qipengyuania sp. S6317L1]